MKEQVGLWAGVDGLKVMADSGILDSLCPSDHQHQLTAGLVFSPYYFKQMVLKLGVYLRKVKPDKI